MLLLLALQSAMAYDVFKINETADIKIACINNNTICDSTATCNITIFEPNATVFLNNKQMSYGGAYFNYTIPGSQTLSEGRHSILATCTMSGQNAYVSDFIEFTINGNAIPSDYVILAFSIGFMFAMIALAVFILMFSSAYTKSNDFANMPEKRMALYKSFFKPLFWFGSIELILLGITFGMSGFMEISALTSINNLLETIINLITMAMELLLTIYILFLLYVLINYFRYMRNRKARGLRG